MNASPSRDGFDEDRLGEFAGQVQAQLAPCANCQPLDKGKPVWLDFHAHLDDLMEMLDVPKACRDEVAERLDCPCCHHPHALYEEVGYKGDVELHYNKLVDAWQQEYQVQFDAFHKYLEDFPYRGLDHEFGRRIYQGGSGLLTTVITDDIWYCARRRVDGRELTSPDFYPPDPNRCVIGEGRFNHHGQSLFYLAGNAYAAATEVMREDEATAWVQKFRIRGIERILDLTHEEGWADESLSVIAAGLMYVGASTRPVERQNGWKPEHLVPRFVADCAQTHGFEGIAFKDGTHYFDNLLLFNLEPGNIVPEGEPTIVKVGQSYRRTATDIGGVPSATEELKEVSRLSSRDLEDSSWQAEYHEGGICKMPPSSVSQSPD